MAVVGEKQMAVDRSARARAAEELAEFVAAPESGQAETAAAAEGPVGSHTGRAARA
jgi:hypothetical protein